MIYISAELAEVHVLAFASFGFCFHFMQIYSYKWIV